MSPAVPVAEPSIQADERTSAHRLWATVVHDDPINTMDYVTWVFASHFGYPRSKAAHLMMQVHMTGRATVSRGERARMEADVTAMHSYGLRATIEPLAGLTDGGGEGR
ncbi:MULTISPECIES: ATP-dependent Clp protease adapter ClpS [Actinomyces]|uniref:ATP-dependent Clp protease adapter ClpS n=1 Tax=Actinomyces marmotae TaxID=2737173 RepID=A0A6M8B9U9_9ACTO|nr:MULTISPECIES: ATP-dependent Clp protease adapter ClpS [Actinomyces]QKD79993.1 ATP-dependent Clp protease adapter ClpS [Actinomyces marmotae]